MLQNGLPTIHLSSMIEISGNLAGTDETSPNIFAKARFP